MDGRPFATTKLLGCENQLSMNTNETDRGELAPEPFDAPVTSTDAAKDHCSAAIFLALIRIALPSAWHQSRQRRPAMNLDEAERPPSWFDAQLACR
jgi:hypothetical protein